MNKKGTKIIASILVFIIMFAYINIIEQVIAVTSQESFGKYVKLDAYFKEENENPSYAKIIKIGEENYINVEVSVMNAEYLKEGYIQFENPNFKIASNYSSVDVTKIETNKLTLRRIIKGETVILRIPIEFEEKEQISEQEMQNQNQIKLEGTYVDEKGTQKTISETTTLALGWTKDKKAELSVEISKYIPDNIAKRAILQTIVKSNLENNALAVKKEEIEISVPSLSNIEPQSVSILAKTKATNGNESTQQLKANQEYTYNKESKKITITIENTENQQGKISWNKDAQDEFVITYIYKAGDSQTFQDTTYINTNAKLTLTLLDGGKTSEGKDPTAWVEKEKSGERVDKKGNLVDVELKTNIKTLDKGPLYSSYFLKEANNTQRIKQTITANILSAELVNQITIKSDLDELQQETGEKIANNEYKVMALTMNKNNFDTMIQDYGYIKISTNGTEITRITKNNVSEKINSEGNIQIVLGDISNIEVEVNGIKTEGKIEMILEKQTKVSNISNMQKAKYIKLNTTIEGIENQEEQKIELIEPTTQTEFTVTPANLSAVVTNSDVKMTAILKTDKTNCKLFANPTLEITLPNYIENIEIKSVETKALNNSYAILDIAKQNDKNYSIVQNTDGSKTLNIKLEGTQKLYTIGELSKGLNVEVIADITLNKLTPSKENEKIVMQCTNNYMSKETIQTSANINIVAPKEALLISTVSNYAQGKDKVQNVGNEEKTAIIPVMQNDYTIANFEMNLINNYDEDMENIKILGRIPKKQNKDIETSKDLGTTFNMELVSNINVEAVKQPGMKVYYSENAEATRDLENEQNGWTTNYQNLKNIKSYLIVVPNSLAKGEQIKFRYSASIPAGLNYNEYAYQVYEAEFERNLSTTEGTASEKVHKSSKIGITTGTGPILEASMESDKKETVKTDEYIKYTLTVKNTGTEEAKNVNVQIGLPACLAFVKQNEQTGNYTQITQKIYTANIGNIEAGKEVQKNFMVVVKNENLQPTISLKAQITAENVPNKIETNEVTNSLEKAYFDIEGYASSYEEVLSEGATISYNYKVKLKEGETKAENTVFTMVIPEGLKYESTKVDYKNITEGITYNEKTKTLTINLGEITNYENRAIEVNATVENLPQGVYEKEIKAQASVKADGTKEETSKEIISKIGKANVKISQTSTIAEGEKIPSLQTYSYIYEIENTGAKYAQNITFKTTIPKGLIYLSTKVETNESQNEYRSINSNNEIEELISVNAGEKVKITIEVRADALEQDTQVSSLATISSEKIGQITSNTINHTIKSASSSNQADSENGTRKIMGQVWKDENKDGIKDENEEKIANVEVMLFNNNTKQYVVDENNNIIKVKTSENGVYSFENIAEGNYTVVFLYNSGNYSPTTYKKENVDETKNSDATETKLTIDGETKLVAITEQIKVEKENIYNIDLGLVENKKFDLRLDKTVTKITVQDSSQTKVYEYKDAKIAKKDLVGKKVNDTTILVEYKIAITNEGGVAGYVKKIVDYMPQEMKFSSEINKDWYTTSNGELFNSSLANTIINPGETKQVTLILSKKMSENSLGLISNTAEIYETYNDLGLEDIDSKVANKATGEDDISNADILITVKTGETIMFVGLSLTIITVIGTSAYIIKKKVLH